MFGQCDPRFVFGAVRKSSDYTPCTYFPNGYYTHGGCVVDIHISDWPWEHRCYDQGTWQVAHECVHLLDPGYGGSSNFLEEGLATWFQDESRFHDNMVKRYISRTTHPLPYHTAKQLVLRCRPQLIAAVKGIRSSGIRLRDISADMLAAHLPNVDKETVERMCARFSS